MLTKMMGTEKFIWFIGRVENIMDPGSLGRVQVRFYGLHEADRSLLATEDLPWAVVALPTTAAGVNGIGQNHGLRPGSDVWGFLADGIGAQLPMVCGVIASASQGASLQLASADGPPGVGVNGNTNPLTPEDISGQATNGPSVVPSEKIDADAERLLGQDDSSSFAPQIGPGTVGSLTNNQVQAYKAWLASVESSGKYPIVNQFGFCGKYQMGALSLIEVGLVKSSSIPRNVSDVSQNQLLNNPAVWTGKWSCNSRADYLSKGAVQEMAQDALIARQYQYAQSYGCVNSSSPPGAVAGYIAACHISLKAMISIKNGGDVRDGNGTSAKGRFMAAKRVVENVS